MPDGYQEVYLWIGKLSYLSPPDLTVAFLPSDPRRGRNIWEIVTFTSTTSSVSLNSHVHGIQAASSHFEVLSGEPLATNGETTYRRTTRKVSSQMVCGEIFYACLGVNVRLDNKSFTALRDSVEISIMVDDGGQLPPVEDLWK